MVNDTIRTHYLRLPSRIDTDTCIIEDPNDSADLWNLRVMGSFRTKKKTPTTELIFFRRKVKNICFKKLT